jgi:rare lipoprotein A
MKKKLIPCFYMAVLLAAGGAVVAQEKASVASSPVSASTQEGVASWYGAEFAGRPTASGEIFDPSKLTASHPTLPFGTMLTVTNLANGKSVEVRVNDRGPFTKSRLIDVSRAAAEKLGMLGTGTARVRIVVDSLGATAPAGDGVLHLSAPDVSGPAAVAVTPAPKAVAPARATQIEPIAPNTLAGAAPVPPAKVDALPAVPAAPYTPPVPPAPMVDDNAQAGAPDVVTPPDPAAAAATATVPPPVVAQSAQIMGAAIEPGMVYRLQVGAFKTPRNAVIAFDRLKKAGLKPAWEPYGEYYRIVLTGVAASDVPSVAAKLGTAGFATAQARLESVAH